MLLKTHSGDEVRLLLKNTKDILKTELTKVFLLLPEKPVTIHLYDIQPKQERQKGHSVLPNTEFVIVQVTAVMEAALAAAAKGALVLPRLTIPFTASECEIWRMAELIHSTVRPIITDLTTPADEQQIDMSLIQYEVGAVLATPRSCLRARHIAAQASIISSNLQFITFDTDNLTQLVWGLQRDLSEDRFTCQSPSLARVITANPFQTIDQQVCFKAIMLSKLFCSQPIRVLLQCLSNPFISICMCRALVNSCAWPSA
jgi:hypothetical protein